jgi:prolyl-tRNA editing enzyme YbaK/EbsC (Cys-tRNA(Pro) deacylase)
VIKTLVMEDDRGEPLIILMHGDRVGGTSPFGTKKPLRVFMEEGIADLPRILINAGSRGLLAEMSPAELIRVLTPIVVKVAL